MTARRATLASALAAIAIGAPYAALTWDAWLTNFQVRWMCDEDVGFVLLRKSDVDALAIPEEMSQLDARALAVFGRAYPTVVVPDPRDAERPAYELAERWPATVRAYWGYAVVRSELSVIDRADGNRVLGTSSLYRRVERGTDAWRAVRGHLAPEPEQCFPSDRVAFVNRVLAPPPQP